MEPSRFGYDIHQKVLDSISAFKNEVTDSMTGKFYVVADLLGIIQEKELINSARLEKKSVFDVTDNKLDIHQHEFIKH